MPKRRCWALLSAALLIAASESAAACAAGLRVDAGDIGGVVTGANGPEAGVWVIAETKGPADEVRQGRRDR